MKQFKEKALEEPVFIDYDLTSSHEINEDWIPFSNWLRFRFDNDNIIIITNLKTGSSIFVNMIAGLTLKLCNGHFMISEIVQGIVNKFPQQNREDILDDVRNVILYSHQIGNIVLINKTNDSGLNNE